MWPGGQSTEDNADHDNNDNRHFMIVHVQGL